MSTFGTTLACALLFCILSHRAGANNASTAPTGGVAIELKLSDANLIARATACVKGLPREYQTDVAGALCAAGANAENLLSAMDALPAEQREGLAFLLANMPEKDLKSLPKSLLVENVSLAYKAQKDAPWGKEISAEMFLNNVLPYANLDESRDSWRKDLMERFSARAWKCKTSGEAVRLLNREVFRELKVSYHATKRPRPNQSPAESIKAGYASCSGLSILLVDACRACGIPARIAGIPSWKDGKGDAAGNHGGNHNWVEVWTDGEWHHVGGGEDTELDKAWFTGKTRGPAVDDSKPEHRIYAVSFKKTGIFFPLAWSPANHSVPAENVTARYQK